MAPAWPAARPAGLASDHTVQHPGPFGLAGLSPRLGGKHTTETSRFFADWAWLHGRLQQRPRQWLRGPWPLHFPFILFSSKVVWPFLLSGRPWLQKYVGTKIAGYVTQEQVGRTGRVRPREGRASCDLFVTLPMPMPMPRQKAVEWNRLTTCGVTSDSLSGCDAELLELFGIGMGRNITARRAAKARPETRPPESLSAKTTPFT